MLDLEQIEDLQKEHIVLREVIKMKRKSHIVGNNIKHVIGTVKQALWYCFGIVAAVTASCCLIVFIISC